jgi:hypothetical protein
MTEVDDLHAQAIEVVARTPEVLRALLDGAPAAVVEAPADEDWSPKDVVAHLLITHQIGAIDRIRSMVEHDHPLLMNRDENEELQRSGYQAWALGDLLEAFAAHRETAVAWLRSLEPSAFARTGEHSAVGAVTASEMLFHAAYHDTVHLAQLTRMVGAPFEPLRGAMRAF